MKRKKKIAIVPENEGFALSEQKLIGRKRMTPGAFLDLDTALEYAGSLPEACSIEVDFE